MDIPLLFTSIIISLSLYLLLKATKQLKPKTKSPPSPWKLPIIGHLHHLIRSMDRPQHGVTQLANKYGDLMHLQLGKMSVLVVSSREVATEVLKTHDVAFADRPDLYSAGLQPNFGRLMALSKYDDYWKQMRRIFITELLSTKRILSFSHIKEDETLNLIESIYLSRDSEINLTEKLFVCTSSIICRAAFGSKNKDQLRFVYLINELMIEAGEFNLIEMLPFLEVFYVVNGMKGKLMRMHEEADRIMDNIVDKKFGQVVEPEKESLLDILLRMQTSGDLEVPITREDVKANIGEIFAGGTFNLATTMIWAMVELLRNPRAMEKTQTEIRQVFKGKNKVTEQELQELKYLKQVIKETLRLHIPVPFILPRECREACKLKGYEIPTKTKVIINAWALSRDPKYWEDPECFKPERFDDQSIDFKGTNIEFIPFGAGRRMCPGATFGTINIEYILAKLLYHFDWKLPDQIEPDMTEVYGAVVRKKTDLVVIATPYIFP